MKVKELGLVPQILIGVTLGALTGVLFPELGKTLGLFGQLFVGMLKAVAPLLVLVLVMSAIANRHETGSDGRKTLVVLCLYLIGMVSAALVALLLSQLFPQTIALTGAADGAPPDAVGSVLTDVLFKLIDNPINALLTGNFLGCLSWAVLLGVSFRAAPAPFKQNLQVLADGVSQIVRYVIRLAPIGIFGLVCVTVATVGVEALANYANLAVLLVAAMLVMALFVNPLLVFLLTRSNPYPIVFRCLEESGITAFFTRSSAANIPVNLNLAKKLGISEELYTVTIPVGATVNMSGAAITITTLTLAAANTLGIEVSLATALLLCVISALSACGASGVPSGSLLLIPLACSLFGIPLDVSMQVVAVGFIISVIQDSAETALNSSTDVVYSYAVDRWRKSETQVSQPQGS
ncbi:MAG: serine/threonine transporter SstT [Halioglobus sp.]|jgi:serine/threonine transporter|uniref:Serine/threonine transporter SstT n=1 Tax=Candidatus Seongchinamella marina TaxID=2518990 RepID=A0ABT3SU29_9GAMM|nr:serine/threonine transporter SstT [Candidatus Seongchinamella marina]EEB77374.1 transporter, DAACS family [marine gamma proteobacterium HTCC2148]MBT3410735.1 serine/threonine transporter SstT [Halieaceae bacterium]MDG1387735.1 serine/threonine transporter SstT [Halioglobus sp.]MBT7719269.1 serine/threonine transporter SstT [Halieaceae bacterium]MCX2972842.1 serine/threonine transporter SstT [Candidatus Seongchinamella marina]